MLISIYQTGDNSAGIGIYAKNLTTQTIERFYEQTSYNPLKDENVYLHAIYRSLVLGKKFRTRNLEILCPSITAVNIVNRELPLEPGDSMVPLYIKIRALIHTYESAIIKPASQEMVAAAQKIAISGRPINPEKNINQAKLFNSRS